MKVRFGAASDEDLQEAFAWYNDNTPGLGYDFLDEVDLAIRRIARFPEAAKDLGEGLRRVLLKKYPYGIWYAIENDIVVVYAVAHLHRQPRHWRHRNFFS